MKNFAGKDGGSDEECTGGRGVYWWERSVCIYAVLSEKEKEKKNKNERLAKRVSVR